MQRKKKTIYPQNNYINTCVKKSILHSFNTSKNFTKMNGKYQMLLVICLIFQLIINTHCSIDDDAKLNSNLKRLLVRRQACPDASMCSSPN